MRLLYYHLVGMLMPLLGLESKQMIHDDLQSMPLERLSGEGTPGRQRNQRAFQVRP